MNNDSDYRQSALQKAHFEALIQSGMDGIIAVDGQMRIVLFNQAAEHIFGCRADAVIGKTLDRFIPDVHRNQHRHDMKAFATQDSTGRRMASERVVMACRASGEDFPIDASISHVVVGDSELFTIILRDITERKRAELAVAESVAEARRLLVQIHSVRDDERRHLARELHDDLGQMLAAMRLDIAALQGELRLPSKEVAELLTSLEQLTADAVGSTRRLVEALRPAALENHSLGAAIVELCSDFANRHGIPCHCTGIQGIGADVEALATPAFRLVQESLNNISKHAKASEVWVDIRPDDYGLTVTIRDDGRGMPPPDQVRTGAFGLIGMRERTLSLGGSFAIESAPGGGTTITARLPNSDE